MTEHPQKRQKPTNRTDLRKDIDTHPERGMLGGKLVVDLSTAEYRAPVRHSTYVCVHDYNGSMGHGKTGVGLIATFLFIVSPIIRSQNRELLNLEYLTDDGKDKPEFRCYLPVQVIADFEQLRMGLGLTKGEAMTYALEMFAHTGELQNKYHEYVEHLATTHNVSPKIARGKIKGFWKRMGRKIKDETPGEEFELGKTIY
ncbi:hypothetical protein FD723_40645 (plasmid) [Nostoc sp. C052]|uniref:hypothetical protein n=1 Tax=Nostoc sp. C052 TaxID=2576902 RepID=UPI0015C3E920|nr:hypothetical protein [Nostoc sp. C052]QLE46524.1 hypothetical protein FD723_40645 [Nostoc sp. C052]